MGDFFVQMINELIKALGAVLQLIFSALPTTPFSLLDNSAIAEYLPTINYFIPISAMLGIIEIWLTGIAIYYVYQIALRWIKAIG
jgi:hypothetical protein